MEKKIENMESVDKTYYVTFQSKTGKLLKITQHGQGFFDACRTAMDRMIRTDKSADWEIVRVWRLTEDEIVSRWPKKANKAR